MVYATVADLCRWFGYKEVSEISGQDDVALIDTELFREVVDGYSSGAWTADQVEAANQALQRIETALADASRLADGYLAARYTLPLTEDVIAASALPRIVGDLVHAMLFSDQDVKIVTSRQDKALRWLESVSRGQVRLGADAPAQPPMGAPVVTSAPRVFGR